MPHPHGVELGMLMQMLKDSEARTLKSGAVQRFLARQRPGALDICERAGLNPKANPDARRAPGGEALYKAIQETKLMRPPTDCLSPIGEEQILAGLQKEIRPTSTRPSRATRGVPRQPVPDRSRAGLREAGGEKAAEDMGAEEPVRLLRFANRVPLLYQPGLRDHEGDVSA
jgi:DNA topoisomerase VI subunit B